MSSKPPPSSSSVEQLIQLARAGDEEAREEIFRRCRPLLARWSQERMADARPGGNNPSDIAQEAALRAFIHFDEFEGSTEGEWIAWLKTILNSRATQSFRDAGRKKRGDGAKHLPLDSPKAMEEPAIQQTASQAVAFKEQWHQLLGLFHQLPENQQTAIRLCRLEDLSLAEAGQQLGKSADAVTGLLKRGLETLRASMQDPATTAEAIVTQLRSLRPPPRGE